MALVSFTPVTDGSTASASGVNTPLSTIYNDYNGNITDANVSASAAIAFSKISGGSSTALGAWQSWTPTFANFTKGSATISGKYTQIGKAVFYRLVITLAGDSAMGTAPTFTLPVTSITTPLAIFPIGTATYNNNSSASHNGYVQWTSATTAALRNWDVNNDDGQLTSTVPFTWANLYTIAIRGEYEAA